MKTILYVDDEPLNLLLFNEAFEKDFQIITGSSGLEGLKLLKENPTIDFVFTDMKMPGMSGLEFITAAKEIFPKMPFSILSGYTLSAEIKNALDSKLITGYFQKPYSFEEIISHVEKFCD